MKLKWPFVFAIFALPLLIVFVLHFWGENRFDVPVFHSEGVDTDSICGDINTPFVVQKKLRSPDSLTVIFTWEETADEDLKLQLIRVLDRFNQSPVSIVCISPVPQPAAASVLLRSVSLREYHEIRHCGLLMGAESSVILIDGSGKVRGYYAGEIREEIDRLEVEIQILLTNGEFKSNY